MKLFLHTHAYFLTPYKTCILHSKLITPLGREHLAFAQRLHASSSLYQGRTKAYAVALVECNYNSVTSLYWVYYILLSDT